MFKTKMLVRGLQPSEESAKFWGKPGRIKISQPTGCHTQLSPWRATLKEMGVSGEKQWERRKEKESERGGKRTKGAQGGAVQGQWLLVLAKASGWRQVGPEVTLFSLTNSSDTGHLKPPRAFLILSKVPFRLKQPWKDEQWRPLGFVAELLCGTREWPEAQSRSSYSYVL